MEVNVRLTVNDDAQLVLEVFDVTTNHVVLKVTWDRKSSAHYAEEILEKRRVERAEGQYRGDQDTKEAR